MASVADAWNRAGVLYAVLFALDPSLDVSQYAHTAWSVSRTVSPKA